jgi:hypothetical protein
MNCPYCNGELVEADGRLYCVKFGIHNFPKPSEE